MEKSFQDYLYEVDAFYMNSPREIYARVNMARNAMDTDIRAEKLRKSLDESPRLDLEVPQIPPLLEPKHPLPLKDSASLPLNPKPLLPLGDFGKYR